MGIGFGGNNLGRTHNQGGLLPVLKPSLHFRFLPTVFGGRASRLVFRSAAATSVEDIVGREIDRCEAQIPGLPDQPLHSRHVDIARSGGIACALVRVYDPMQKIRVSKTAWNVSCKRG